MWLIKTFSGRNNYYEHRTLNNVDDKIIELLIDAYNQEKYLKNNGEISDWMIIRRNTEMELLNTGYILKFPNYLFRKFSTTYRL